MAEPDSMQKIYSVSELNAEIRSMLEIGFGLIWIEAEISNLARPASGHWYFSLKDADAQVRCAMFRNRNRYLDFSPEDGSQVLVRAKVSLYEPRGEYQLIVEHMDAAGDGALKLEFERLKNRLQEDGLFDSSHKKALPALPAQIGIITSATGAAIHDILHVLERRFPSIPVMLYPVPVQGENAAEKIISMIKKAQRRHECDVLILARGGGSLEDLWAFNSEALARTLYECEIPTVTGIGHETDFTIADFVADARAPTPSAAAELITPDRHDWLGRFRGFEAQLLSGIQRVQQGLMQRSDWLEQRLKQQHPGRRIQEQSSTLNALQHRMELARKSVMNQNSTRLTHLSERIIGQNPINYIKQNQYVVETLEKRLKVHHAHSLQSKRQRLERLMQALNTMNPLSTLGRGFSITKNASNKTVIRSVTQVSTGDWLETQVEDGVILSEVKDV
jgi:exodeoxyribonuclease VII large subunit